MARRAFLPTLPPAPAPPSASRVSNPPPSVTGDGRRTVPPPTGGTDRIAVTAIAQLLDRLVLADDLAFAASWMDALGPRLRLEPVLGVRLLQAYRELGRMDRARELSGLLPTVNPALAPLEGARLSIERALLALHDSRTDVADAELRQASRALSLAPKGAGAREQLDWQVATIQLELKLGRVEQATAALKVAEHIFERVEVGPSRINLALSLGHLSMRLAEPRAAARYYAAALASAPTRSISAMAAHANFALACASTARLEEAHASALASIDLAQQIAGGLRHADAYDVLATVEMSRDQPAEALAAIDEAIALLGDSEQPVLRYQLFEHRTWALSALGRDTAIKPWLGKMERARVDLPQMDPLEEQAFNSVKARALEASGDLQEAFELASATAIFQPDAYITGILNVLLARVALKLGNDVAARQAIERAALSGDKHGWVFPERDVSRPVWQLAQRTGDSRIVRYAERVLALADGQPIPTPAASSRLSMIPRPSQFDLREGAEPVDGETLIYVTTPQGVSRVPSTELARALEGSNLVVDTMTHALRVDNREVSLERRRALEPLVVQLLRRAREGLSAEEILRAAGGPGPESADAEHRVRVLISRVRDLLGDPASIERVRDAGEHGRTRYRLAPGIRFALVEPLGGN